MVVRSVIVMKLNQVLAILTGVSNSSREKITELHRVSGTKSMYDGLEKVYTPVEEDGPKFPSESQMIQLKSSAVLDKAAGLWSELFNLTYTKDVANCEAKADISVDGKILMKDVPVTYLLFLEKKLQDVRTFIQHVPTLDASESWTYDDNKGVYVSSPVDTHKTKKVTRAHVLYPATKEHPAQVKEISEDVLVGYWKKIKSCAALPVPVKETYEKRVDSLLQAVKLSREHANSSTAVKESAVGPQIFGYLFS